MNVIKPTTFEQKKKKKTEKDTLYLLRNLRTK